MRSSYIVGFLTFDTGEVLGFIPCETSEEIKVALGRLLPFAYGGESEDFEEVVERASSLEKLESRMVIIALHNARIAADIIVGKESMMEEILQ